MRSWKGFLVVLVVYGVITLQRSFFAPDPSIFPPQTYFYFALVRIIPIGVLSWFLLSLITHTLSKRLFKKEGNIDDILYGFGIAHFPFMLSSLSFFLIFIGSVGFFASTFFAMFFGLLAYFFLIEAIVAFYGFSWKKAFALFALTIVIFSGVMLLLPFLGISQFPQTILLLQLFDTSNFFVI